MNVADSQRVASALEHLGCQHTPHIEEADIIVMNTCVVRQSAEDKAYGRLQSLKPLKESKPGLIINLMGCMVGTLPTETLKKRLPMVDVFSPPSDPGPLIAFITQKESEKLELSETARRYAWQDGELILPETEQGKLVSAFIPIVYGCSHACAYCIIPYRRGKEHSRPPQDILQEAHSLSRQGVKEITLLGQIVDRYGKDEPDYPKLPRLLEMLQEVDGIQRIRFLTSHPNWFSDDLIETIRRLDKVMPHIEIPAQSGDDQILESMRRGYTDRQYRDLVARIRDRIPGVSIATDVIVGFPGETEEQFEHTRQQLEDLKLDVAHLARYSPRPGTLSARLYPDNVPDEEKWRRFRILEKIQEEIAAEIHARCLNTTVEVLFEEKVKKRWRGRTPSNKLVFVESDENLFGKVLPITIDWSGPWSMIGHPDD